MLHLQLKKMCLESLNSADWAETFCIISLYRFIQRYVTKVHLFFGFYYIFSQLFIS